MYSDHCYIGLEAMVGYYTQEEEKMGWIGRAQTCAPAAFWALIGHGIDAVEQMCTYRDECKPRFLRLEEQKCIQSKLHS